MKKNILITSILLFFVLSCKTDSQEQTNTTSNTKLKIQNSIKAKIVTSKGDIIIKLVKQSNQIVEFLRQLDVEIKDASPPLLCAFTK